MNTMGMFETDTLDKFAKYLVNPIDGQALIAQVTVRKTAAPVDLEDNFNVSIEKYSEEQIRDLEFDAEYETANDIIDLPTYIFHLNLRYPFATQEFLVNLIGMVASSGDGRFFIGCGGGFFVVHNYGTFTVRLWLDSQCETVLTNVETLGTQYRH